MKRVAILGGGVGGLSAAHELVKHGFAVDVYERDGELGGKARSQLVPDPRDPSRLMPGEHGFRFYPHFYKHLFATMREIPFTPGPNRAPSSDGTVYGNLVESSEAGIADGRIVIGPRTVEGGPLELARTTRALFRGLDVTARDAAIYAGYLFRFLTSCPERREAEYERMTWTEYVGRTRHYSPAFARLLAAVPRTMVAMSADIGSARTIGTVSSQLFFTFDDDRGGMDATMTGPTTQVWLAPWRDYLVGAGVRFHHGVAIDRFELDRERIARVWAGGRAIEADYYVSAMPLEVMQRLIDDRLATADESLARVRGMDRATAWMTGAQFFLRRDTPLCRGHMFYPGADWGLTSISQAQFWRPRMGSLGDHFARDLAGVISVDISDWDTRSQRTGKRAKDCTSADEILDEVWTQLCAGLGSAAPDRADVIGRHLDSNIVFRRDAQGHMRPHNTTPLLIHRPGSWFDRPDAELRIPNLVLASDYVRTATDLASMEGANEAARRAVRGLLRREGLDANACPIWPLSEGRTLELAQRADRLLFLAGRPHAQPIAA